MGEYREKRRPHVRIRIVGTLGATIAFALAIVALSLLSRVFDVNERSLAAHNDYAECSMAASELMAASDYLTTQARLFIMAGDVTALDDYLNEVNVVDRRTASLETLKDDFGGTRAYTALFNANAESHSLSIRELYAMRLAADAYGIYDLPQELADVTLKDKDAELSRSEKKALAEEMVLGDQYQLGKEIIIEQVSLCNAELIDDLREQERIGSRQLSGLLYWLRIITFALLAIVLIFLFVVFHYVIAPLAHAGESISREEKLALEGAHELCVVADAYNDMFDDISRKTDQLRFEAEHDALTGVLNRGSYDHLLEACWATSALVLADVDRFKEINDDYGHTSGDKILRLVAEVLQVTFAEGAHVCRIGGDEFAVILVDTYPEDRDRICHLLEGVRARLRGVVSGLPVVTLSCGVAFGACVEGGRDGLYRAADEALYSVKHRGRDGVAFLCADNADGTEGTIVSDRQG